MRIPLGWSVWLGCSLSWICCGGAAEAQAALSVPLAQPKQLRIDGELGEWRGARFVRLGDNDAGRMEVALAHDAQGLYLAARVFDDAFVRSAQPGPHEDAVVVRLALPAAGSFVTNELWLFAGRMGQSAASAQLGAPGSKQLRALDGATRIVEGPLASGYVLEAFVPWASVPHGADWPFARGLVRLHDVDGTGRTVRPAIDVPPEAATKTGANLPWLHLDGGPIEALRGFIDQKNLSSATPLLDWVGDVRGDARAERVLVIGTYAVRSGGGTDFTFADLPVSRAGAVRSAQMQDLTGDAKPELVLRLRAQSELGERELWQVFDVQGDSVRPMFGVETSRQTRAGLIEASVSTAPGAAGQPTQITVRAGKVNGISVADFTASSDQGVVPIPVPWGAWLERVYAWDGQRFAVRRERANPAARAAADPEAMAAPAAAQASHAAAANAPTVNPAGVPASSTELMAAYRSARGVPADQPARFGQRVNLAGDARPEMLSVFGLDCLVVGEGFRGGRDFFYFTLPARAAADVLRVFTGDVTGDARHELFARIRQQIGPVTREIVYVYTFAAERLVPLLAVEVSRTQGTQSVTNAVTLVPDGNHVALQIAPGTARGWSAADYPFSSESHDEVAPLLLPWIDKPKHYQYDGQRLTPRLSSD